jgi:hypothetical protein
MARLLSAFALLSAAAPLSAGPMHHHPRHESHRHEWMEHHHRHHEAATEPVLGLSPGLCHEHSDGGGMSSGGTQLSGGSSQSADPTPAAVQTPPHVPEPGALLLAGIAIGLWRCRRLLVRASVEP